MATKEQTGLADAFDELGSQFRSLHDHPAENPSALRCQVRDRAIQAGRLLGKALETGAFPDYPFWVSGWPDDINLPPKVKAAWGDEPRGESRRYQVLWTVAIFLWLRRYHPESVPHGTGKYDFLPLKPGPDGEPVPITEGVTEDSEIDYQRLRALDYAAASLAIARLLREAPTVGWQEFAALVAESELTGQPQDDRPTEEAGEMETSPWERGLEAHEHAFRKLGDFWFFRFDGRNAKGPVKHQNGFEYIASLLRTPNKHIECNELHALVNKAPGGSKRSETSHPEDDDEDREKRRPGDHVDDMFDDEGIEKTREYLRELDREIETAERNNDLGTLEDRREKRQQTIDYLTSGTSLGKHTRQFAGDTERARKSVSNAITRAIKAIQDVHPNLARHLDESIETGKDLVYRPSQSIDWDI